MLDDWDLPVYEVSGYIPLTKLKVLVATPRGLSSYIISVDKTDGFRLDRRFLDSAYIYGVPLKRATELNERFVLLLTTRTVELLDIKELSEVYSKDLMSPYILTPN